MKEITTDYEKMMADSITSTRYYLRNIIEELDNRWGADYAKEHPELVGALVQACAIENSSAMSGRTRQDIAEAISNSGNQISCSIEILSNKI